MRNKIYAAGLLAMLMCLAGCKWYTYQDTTVLVTNGETGEPLADAAVYIQAIPLFTFNIPEDLSVKTDHHGTARLRLVDNNPFFLGVEVEGYRGMNFSWGYMRKDESSPPFRVPQENHVTLSIADPSDGRDTAQLKIKLFREPTPSLRIVVPDGYRGLIKVHLVRYPGDSPWQPTGRVHQITTNLKGEVSLIESHLYWDGFDRRDHIVVAKSGREYPLVRHRSGSLAASWIQLHRVPGMLIHLGAERDHARNVPTIPGRRRTDLGGVELTRIPGYEEVQRFMQGARQEPPQ